MEYYVYLLQDSITSRIFYVGKGKRNRMNQHLRYVQKYDKPMSTNLHIFHTIRKILSAGGTVNAIKICEGLDENTALDIEAETIEFFGIDNLCNISPRGSSSTPPSDTATYAEHKEKQSIASKRSWADPDFKNKMLSIRKQQGLNMRGENHPNYNKTPTEETRIKISIASKERKWSESQREKMVNIMTGRKILWADKIGESNKKIWETKERIPMCEERREKARIQMTGKEFLEVSDELKNKIVELYEYFGPNRIQRELKAQNIEISLYIIRRTLKNAGIYKKYRKNSPL